MSIIIGINWEQNSSVALLINGKIIEAVSEERFSRLKNDERYPRSRLIISLKNTSSKK